MIAAQRFNASSKKTVYGIATSGEFWKFGKLTDRTFIMDPRAHSATSDLQQLLNVLSWFFREAKKELTRQK